MGTLAEVMCKGPVAQAICQNLTMHPTPSHADPPYPTWLRSALTLVGEGGGGHWMCEKPLRPLPSQLEPGSGMTVQLAVKVPLVV